MKKHTVFILVMLLLALSPTAYAYAQARFGWDEALNPVTNQWNAKRLGYTYRYWAPQSYHFWQVWRTGTLVRYSTTSSKQDDAGQVCVGADAPNDCHWVDAR